MVGKTIFGAPLKLMLMAITQIGIGAMTIAQTQRQISYIHMKALSYIGRMIKKQKLFAIKNVSMTVHMATIFCFNRLKRLSKLKDSQVINKQAAPSCSFIRYLGVAR